MKKYAVIALCMIVALLSAGCSATGPKYNTYRASIPAVPADKGRVYFYRDDSFIGGGLRPDIKLNGVVVGESLPGAFFYVDQAPGACAVSTSTEVERTVEFNLNPAEVKYIRTYVSMGVLVGHVSPELVGKADAENAMADLSFAGKLESNKPPQ